MHFILPPGALLSAAKCSEQRVLFLFYFTLFKKLLGAIFTTNKDKTKDKRNCAVELVAPCARLNVLLGILR